MTNSIRVPYLTRRRIVLALIVAITADAIQVLLGPLGWTLFDEVIDVIAMIAIGLLIGFHPLLLPTFVLEFIPVIDMLPTWIGCSAIVIALRKKQQESCSVPPVISTPPNVIDV